MFDVIPITQIWLFLTPWPYHILFFNGCRKKSYFVLFFTYLSVLKGNTHTQHTVTHTQSHNTQSHTHSHTHAVTYTTPSHTHNTVTHTQHSHTHNTSHTQHKSHNPHTCLWIFAICSTVCSFECTCRIILFLWNAIWHGWFWISPAPPPVPPSCCTACVVSVGSPLSLTQPIPA